MNIDCREKYLLTVQTASGSYYILLLFGCCLHCAKQKYQNVIFASREQVVRDSGRRAWFYAILEEFAYSINIHIYI